MIRKKERIKHIEELQRNPKFQSYLEHCKEIEKFTYEELVAALMGAFQTEQHLREHSHILQMRILQLEQQLAARNAKTASSTIN